MTTSSIRVTSRACLLALALGAASFVAVPGPAFAQSNEAIAESLFIEGKQLFSEQKYAEACQKLAQSHKADPAGGTVLLLAMCYEQLGRTASAWAKYGEAVAMARRDGRHDRAQKAQEYMDALTSRLSYVTVTLEPTSRQQKHMEFVLDDIEIPLLIDAKVPVDPGSHRLLVRARDFESWSHDFEITDSGALVTITVPTLKPNPVQPAAPLDPNPSGANGHHAAFNAPPAVERHTIGATRTVGWVVGGLGVVSVGLGGYFALRAKSLANKSDGRCPTVDCGDATALDWNKDALRDATASTWLIGLGAAAVTTGGVLLLFGGEGRPSVSTSAMALPSGGAIQFMGTY